MSSSTDGFARLASSIDYPMYIVTTAAHGTLAGCLVGFLTQSSIEPPRLLVCLSKANATFRVTQQAGVLVVHFLGDGDRDLARLFGEETGDEVDKFSQCEWEEGPAGLPIVAGCRGWLAGSILDRLDCGDHVAHLVEPFDGAAPRPDEPQLGFRQVRDLQPGHPTD
jgi:flavin reductase (DIM6/NTAB) family NADH-FMN oxidoreductase RutF